MICHTILEWSGVEDNDLAETAIILYGRTGEIPIQSPEKGIYDHFFCCLLLAFALAIENGERKTAVS